MKIYTRKGDDGTTGLLYGGRVPKDSAQPTAYGSVDELQAALGLARAEAERRARARSSLQLERDLWVLMAELATEPSKREQALRRRHAGDRGDGRRPRGADRRDPRAVRPADRVRRPWPDPGERPARRGPHRCPPSRARRHRRQPCPEARSVPYLNRLSDLLWTLARWQEGASLPTRSVEPGLSSDPTIAPPAMEDPCRP